MLPRINKIINVELYKIVCVWNSNETRVIDFSDWFNESKLQTQSTLYQLFEPSVFMSVRFDDEQKNIVWPYLLPLKNDDGTIEMVDLDFSPEVLYKMSTLLAS